MILAGKHRHDTVMMPVAPLLEGDGLGHVPAAFALDEKLDSHGIG